MKKSVVSKDGTVREGVESISQVPILLAQMQYQSPAVGHLQMTCAEDAMQTRFSLELRYYSDCELRYVSRTLA